MLDALDVPPTTSIKVTCWSVCPEPERGCLRTPPSPRTSAATQRTPTAPNPPPTVRTAAAAHALSPSPLGQSTATPNSCSPPGAPSSRQCSPRTAINTSVRKAGRACGSNASGMPTTPWRGNGVLYVVRVCVPLGELCALSVCAKAAVCGADDWYEMFVGSIEITHVSAPRGA